MPNHVAFKNFACTRSIKWELFGVNFRPLQEIEAIMGGGRIFDTGPFFARQLYIDVIHIIKAPRPFPSIFAYCRLLKTGQLKACE